MRGIPRSFQDASKSDERDWASSLLPLDPFARDVLAFANAVAAG